MTKPSGIMIRIMKARRWGGSPVAGSRPRTKCSAQSLRKARASCHFAVSLRPSGDRWMVGSWSGIGFATVVGCSRIEFSEATQALHVAVTERGDPSENTRGLISAGLAVQVILASAMSQLPPSGISIFSTTSSLSWGTLSILNCSVRPLIQSVVRVDPPVVWIPIVACIRVFKAPSHLSHRTIAQKLEGEVRCDPMKVTSTAIPDVLLLELEYFDDDRGRLCGTGMLALGCA